MRIEIPPLGVLRRTTPGKRPSRVFSTDPEGVFDTSWAVTVWPALLRSGAGAVCGVPPPPLEQADAKPRSNALQNRRRDGNDDMGESSQA
jgi:hypothetical protein